MMLHGWGMHSGLWDRFAQALAIQQPVTLIDLPGHGHSQSAHAAMSLDVTTQTIKSMIDQDTGASVLLGWSLGGLVAMQLAAQYPTQVSKLILIASNARFTRAVDWQCALPHEVLEQFAAQLQADHRATLQRFLALQVRGSENERQMLHELKQQLATRPPPQQAALHSGLQLLHSTDLRHTLEHIQCPVLLIQGSHDRIVPAAAGTAQQALLSNARLLTIEGAGHAPFLSHSNAVITAINQFLHGQ